MHPYSSTSSGWSSASRSGCGPDRVPALLGGRDAVLAVRVEWADATCRSSASTRRRRTPGPRARVPAADPPLRLADARRRAVRHPPGRRGGARPRPHAPARGPLRLPAVGPAGRSRDVEPRRLADAGALVDRRSQRRRLRQGAGISHRHHTVPLAQLLRTRQTLRSRLAHAELDLNSFEAVRMEERIVSSDVATSWHDHPAPKPERSRMSLFGSPPRVGPRGSQAGPGSEDSVKALTARAMHHTPRRTTCSGARGGGAGGGHRRRGQGAGAQGSLTAGEYVAATVLLKSSKHTLRR